MCDSADGTLKGTVGVYVDDLLLMTSESELPGLIKAIRDTWRCSEPSFATTPGGFTFCGVQIEKVGHDLWIHQRKYIGDLKQRYPNIRPTTQLPEFRNEPPAEEPLPSRIQYAQKVIGELTWVACRTRLDLAYVVKRLSRYAVSNPDYASTCGEQILGYLACREASAAFEDELPVPRTPTLLEIWTDASFAQADSKSQSGIVVSLGGAPIGWLSLRQPFISLSTCEAELVSCVEGVVLAQSFKPLLEELSGSKLRWLLLNDNVAASTVILYPSGSWRTRHLRLRSRAVQELVDMEQLELHHVPGRVMIADILTKTLAYPKICELMSYLGYEGFKPPGHRAKSSVSTPPKLLLLCLASPAPVHACAGGLTQGATAFRLGWIVGLWQWFGQRFLFTAECLSAAACNAKQGPDCEQILWGLLTEHGPRIVMFLDPRGGEVLCLQEVSGRIRLRIASVWAVLNPRIPATPRREESEDTDSGISLSTQSTPPSLTREWQEVHGRFLGDPEYDPLRVEDAFQIWALSNYPYGPELGNLRYVTSLSPLEHTAFYLMIDAYFLHTPSAASSPTPEPSHLVTPTAGDEGFVRREVVERTLEQMRSLLARQESIAQTSQVQNPSRGRTDMVFRDPNESVLSQAAASDVPVLRLTDDASSDSEESGIYEMDFQIAAAACMLYQYNYNFDWEQLSQNQQEIYHGMIGRLLQSLSEVD